jgi:hypothetical protein
MKGYRTLIFSLAVAVVGVLQTFDWASVVPAEHAGAALTIVGIAAAILRVFTSTPIGAKE